MRRRSPVQRLAWKLRGAQGNGRTPPPCVMFGLFCRDGRWRMDHVGTDGWRTAGAVASCGGDVGTCGDDRGAGRSGGGAVVPGAGDVVPGRAEGRDPGGRRAAEPVAERGERDGDGCEACPEAWPEAGDRPVCGSAPDGVGPHGGRDPDGPASGEPFAGVAAGDGGSVVGDVRPVRRVGSGGRSCGGTVLDPGASGVGAGDDGVPVPDDGDQPRGSGRVSGGGDLGGGGCGPAPGGRVRWRPRR